MAIFPMIDVSEAEMEFILQENPFWARWRGITPYYLVYKYKFYQKETHSFVFRRYRSNALMLLPYHSLMDMSSRGTFKPFLLQGEKKTPKSTWRW